MQPLPALDYAGAFTGVAIDARRWSRLAVGAVVPAILTPVVAFCVALLVDGGAFPDHFFCCKHPEVAIALFVVPPGVGAALGAVAVARLIRWRRRLKGWVPAVVATLLNPLVALGGFGLYRALKM